MKRVLITAGQVYGPLDDNKLVGNRVRGIWAARFADYLADEGYPVTLLVPDVNTPLPPGPPHDNLKVVTHKGYWDYAEKCARLASSHDAAVMAAAVVNWIPAEPVKGKMATAGYKEGDIINVPFVLAPRVINRMRTENPNLTLVGCKMLIGSTPEELVEAAYHVVLAARCNVVVANDMKAGLRTKRLVYQDRTVVDYEDDFEGFFAALRAVIDDEHYRTAAGHLLREPPDADVPDQVYLADLDARNLMTRIVEKYRDRFVHRQAGSDRVFGAVGIPLSNGVAGYLLSPREKGEAFDGSDGVLVARVNQHRIVETVQGKATLNAPLLVRMMLKYGEPVIHLHEQLPGVPTVPYAPPGTVRDCDREIPGRAFNIEGHGFVACLDWKLEIVR